jgi:hypothetical protein
MAEHDLPDRPVLDDEEDTEGNAFKWEIVDDPKGGKRLRQGWNVEDPAPGKPQPRNGGAEPKR